MSVSSTDGQEDILTSLDREAGWKAAELADQRARELKRHLDAIEEHQKIYRPRIDAWFRIVRILQTAADPASKIAEIQAEVDAATLKSSAVESDFRETKAKAYRAQQENLDAARAAGAGTHA